MGRKRMPGLTKRGECWHVNKVVDGVRVYESTGTGRLEEAERYLARRLETIRQARVYGVRPKRLFREAAAKFLRENQHKLSIRSDKERLHLLDSYIGSLDLESIHMGTLQPYITAREKDGVKTRTINHGLQIVRRILNLAACEWRDEYGLTWLGTAPKIKFLLQRDVRRPYPLNWKEQERLFEALPEHLRDMALFAVNTGCRDNEVCKLRWEWEVNVPIAEMGSVFIIPGEKVKNGDDRVVVLNRAARAVVERQRGKHAEYVFTYRGRSVTRMLNSGWLKARRLAELPKVRVHDLKHTFGGRLRAAGVSFEDRQDLLGHRSGRITTHYSNAQLLNLWKAANKACVGQNAPFLTLLRVNTQPSRVKVAQAIL